MTDQMMLLFCQINDGNRWLYVITGYIRHYILFFIINANGKKLDYMYIAIEK